MRRVSIGTTANPKEQAMTDLDRYEAACYSATMDQGLGAVVVALASAQVPVVVDQTGGMTMVAAVHRDDGAWLGVTVDGEATGDNAFLVCWYRDAEDEGVVFVKDATLGEVAMLGRAFWRLGR